MSAPINRRQFVALTVAGACAACFGDAADACFAADTMQSKAKVDCGELSSLAADGVADTWKDEHKFLLVRHDGKIYAVSARCTHKAGILNVESGQHIVCPKHGSKFDANGDPIEGPAKAPLFRYGVSVNGEKHVIVDLGKTYTKKDFEKKGAFVAV
jgi:nitrite reductase/ring-hydroxylating ferredoxin subunit